MNLRRLILFAAFAISGYATAAPKDNPLPPSTPQIPDWLVGSFELRYGTDSKYALISLTCVVETGCKFDLMSVSPSATPAISSLTYSGVAPTSTEIPTNTLKYAREMLRKGSNPTPASEHALLREKVLPLLQSNAELAECFDLDPKQHAYFVVCKPAPSPWHEDTILFLATELTVGNCGPAFCRYLFFPLQKTTQRNLGQQIEQTRKQEQASRSRTRPAYAISLNEVRVIVQTCLPDKTVAFESVNLELTGIPKARTLREQREASGFKEDGGSLTASVRISPQDDPDIVSVRQWRYTQGSGHLSRYWLRTEDIKRGSAGTSVDYLWNATEKGQPVFERQGARPEDIVAFAVRDDSVAYWYKLPKEIPTDRFSDWQDPISVEVTKGEGKPKTPFFYLLVHGGEMPINPVSGNPPRLRFRLMTFEEYHDQRRLWARAQKAVGEKYYRGTPKEQRDRLHFVPDSREIIPGC